MGSDLRIGSRKNINRKNGCKIKSDGSISRTHFYMAIFDKEILFWCRPLNCNLGNSPKKLRVLIGEKSCFYNSIETQN